MNREREDATLMQFTLAVTAAEGIRLRQAIKRAHALKKARSDGEAVMLFVDSWLSNEGRRIR